MQTYNQIPQLIIKHLRETITEDERGILQQWIEEDDKHRTLFEQLTHDTTLQNKLIEFSESDKRIRDQVYAQLPELQAMIAFRPKRIWLRWTAAAAAILIIVSVIWYVETRTRPIPKTATTVQKPVNEPILPAGNKATLTLGDGSVVDLSQAQTGTISEQGSSKVVKSKEGELKYQSAISNKQLASVAYNTLRTPRGGQYQLILPDGSKIWLNAASSIKYPTAFTGNERRVEVTGECYFEVSRDQNKPFKVSILPPTGGTEGGRSVGEVEVLGTHFNINAYGDEQPVVTTLLEGKVKISASDEDEKESGISNINDNNKQQTSNNKLLLPGQQATITDNAKITINPHSDTEAAVAWMKGFFDFHNSDIKNVMKQVSRWYNVDISYSGVVSAQAFEGNIDRNIPLNELLSTLEQMSSNIKFKIEGRTVKVE